MAATEEAPMMSPAFANVAKTGVIGFAVAFAITIPSGAKAECHFVLNAGNCSAVRCTNREIAPREVGYSTPTPKPTLIRSLRRKLTPSS